MWKSGQWTMDEKSISFEGKVQARPVWVRGLQPVGQDLDLQIKQARRLVPQDIPVARRLGFTGEDAKARQDFESLPHVQIIPLVRGGRSVLPREHAAETIKWLRSAGEHRLAAFLTVSPTA